MCKKAINKNKQELDSSEEEVFYCPNCFSLKILAIAASSDKSYCFDCGETDIKQTSFESWNKLYISAYKKAFYPFTKE